MKCLLVMLVICCGAAITAFIKPVAKNNSCVKPTLTYVKQQAVLFAGTTSLLENAIRNIDSLSPSSIENAVTCLKNCRLQYKNIEFFLCYFLKSATLVYNEANKYEVEEPFLEAREPAGFQVMEAQLFSGNTASKKEDLLQQAVLINSSAQDIYALMFNLDVNDLQIAESIRLELIRVMTLSITGFDAPELKTGITESKQAILSMETILLPLLYERKPTGNSVRFYLHKAFYLLDKNPRFDSFDRLKFLITAALPLQYYLGLLIKEKGLELNTTATLNYKAKNLFSKGAISLHPENKDNKTLIDLGRQLFFEKELSANSTRSCASCHQPENFFTDGRIKSMSSDGRSTVARNAPSLFYTTFQHTQFWDGRVKNMEEQIQTVLENPVEMGSDHHIAIRQLGKIKNYTKDFNSTFPHEKDSVINIHTLSRAIVAFLGTLSPMNSPFDQYINGNLQALSNNQIRGFNLFMGKAQCGTCHYAPMFNGLIPPLYDRTELEVLGVTKNTNFNIPELDADSGRYTSFPISYYMGAFKTPTLRNVSRTAPYMHNGAFTTLEQVLDFYNKGGAVGLGLNFPSQTLSNKPLQLNNSEIDDIISFLYSLTDKPE